jgi:hypothetical protein
VRAAFRHLAATNAAPATAASGLIVGWRKHARMGSKRRPGATMRAAMRAAAKKRCQRDDACILRPGRYNSA